MNENDPRRTGRVIGTWLSAVLCVAVDVVAVFAVVSSWSMVPRAAWDDDVLTAISVSALLAIVLAVFGGLLRALPVALHWLRWWWFVVPGLVLVAAVARWVWLDLAYPE
ncbi:hypothetical protein OOZ19_21645 [Saccharopolyspora sp. NFXS83]|uniref:hypothetical protein n=1 Tax=Saccharopolyspora sp. NFXS83 TaxID=2993560 RepID=UPI00224B2CBF|nr:hypothetical protein [Saccharopolyspora sp. NFXS83]MCX2732850.1 hypothetical protein [Saccharopolyspora sp. NFXS83]